MLERGLQTSAGGEAFISTTNPGHAGLDATASSTGASSPLMSWCFHSRVAVSLPSGSPVTSTPPSACPHVLTTGWPPRVTGAASRTVSTPEVWTFGGATRHAIHGVPGGSRLRETATTGGCVGVPEGLLVGLVQNVIFRATCVPSAVENWTGSENSIVKHSECGESQR